MSLHPLAFMRLPYGLLSAMDSRMFHFWMQPVHYLVRALHILTMSAFFGMVMLIDLRLMNRRATAALRPVAELALPWLHKTFLAAFVTGLALFFYDPVRVGSRAYLTPKLLLIAFGMANAAYGHRTSYRAVLLDGAPIPRVARLAAGFSLAVWTGVIICSCLNTEAVPKVFLR